MKNSTFTLVTFIFFFCSCSDNQTKEESQKDNKTSTVDTNLTFQIIDDRDNQEKAQDALNSIQVRGSNLYSTFAYGQHKDCKGDIETFTISNTEFEDALLDLLYRYYPNIDMQEKAYLALTASTSQYEYVLTTCGSIKDFNTKTDSIAPSRTGTWIIQAFTDQTDLVILW